MNVTWQIPDTLMDYYMAKAGVECDDLRLYAIPAATNGAGSDWWP